MALRSAWELQRYFAPVSRECRASTSSRTPRGKPLKPVDLISLSGPTITAPTRRPFSLLQRAIWCASSMNRWSQALENIADRILVGGFAQRHSGAPHSADPGIDND